MIRSDSSACFFFPAFSDSAHTTDIGRTWRCGGRGERRGKVSNDAVRRGGGEEGNAATRIQCGTLVSINSRANAPHARFRAFFGCEKMWDIERSAWSGSVQEREVRGRNGRQR